MSYKRSPFTHTKIKSQDSEVHEDGLKLEHKLEISNLSPNKVVVTDKSNHLSAEIYSNKAVPDSFVLRDSDGNSEFKKLDLEDLHSKNIHSKAVHSKLIETETIKVTNLVAEQIVGTDSNNNLISIRAEKTAEPNSLVLRDEAGNIHANKIESTEILVNKLAIRDLDSNTLIGLDLDNNLVSVIFSSENLSKTIVQRDVQGDAAFNQLNIKSLNIRGLEPDKLIATDAKNNVISLAYSRDAVPDTVVMRNDKGDGHFNNLTIRGSIDSSKELNLGIESPVINIGNNKAVTNIRGLNGGFVEIKMGNENYFLSPEEYQNQCITIPDVITADRIIFIPPSAGRVWVIRNKNKYNINVMDAPHALGTGTVIPPKSVKVIFNDGNDFIGT